MEQRQSMGDKRRQSDAQKARPRPRVIEGGQNSALLEVQGRQIRLTNLRKIFWPELGITKGDLIQYYTDVSPVLLPHLQDRAMVMKRYPDGAFGDFFFMKRTPEYSPDWVQTCPIEHSSGNVIAFPVVQDLASLLWIINLGCIDLNPWYARCDDVNRPDYLHFDLDPVEKNGAAPPPFEKVQETALIVRDTLESLGMSGYAKTTGSRGIHVYVPIVRGPTQKEVWTVAKTLAIALAQRHPKLITAEYRIAKRPEGRVLVDYNQNARGRTLSSIYSVRPKPKAPVSAPVTWLEIEQGINMLDFRLDSMRERIAKVGDLWKPLTFAKRGRFNLHELLAETKRK